MVVEKDQEYEKVDEFENLKAFITGKFEDLEGKMSFPDLPLSVALDKLTEQLKIIPGNLSKINDMIKECKGCVSMARAVLQDRRTMTPRWYNLDECAPPEAGEIWVKDIDGNETIAVCKGKAIIYPASSSLKIPEFWKPV